MIKTVAMLLLFAAPGGEPRASVSIYDTVDACRIAAVEMVAQARAAGSSLATLCIQSPQFPSNERPA